MWVQPSSFVPPEQRHLKNEEKHSTERSGTASKAKGATMNFDFEQDIGSIQMQIALEFFLKYDGRLGRVTRPVGGMLSSCSKGGSQAYFESPVSTKPRYIQDHS